MAFASVYPHHVTKIEKKGGIREDLHEVIHWLIGFDGDRLRRLIDGEATFESLFRPAVLHANAPLITEVICGYRIENIESPLMR